MGERYRPKAATDGGRYFEAAPIQFIDTGCTLLNCILGGGWALGRCANIVGDESTGKTLLAIEACVNFAADYPLGKIWYREAEAAFDLHYANDLGLPMDRVDFGPSGIETQWDTIEDIFEDLEDVLDYMEKLKKPVPGLYIVDSLDALTSRAALRRDVGGRNPVTGKGSYNLEKPKALSELFSKLTRRLKRANICLIIVSQLRDKIGVTFGEKKTRSGGRALNFYASHIVWLSHLKTVYREIGKVRRATSIQIRARCKKNKIGKPLRECEFFIEFGFGVDDLEANLDFLAGNKALNLVQRGLVEKDLGKFMRKTETAPDDVYRSSMNLVRRATIECWNTVEKGFLPRRPKYRAND